jgi:membrane-bound lytic murein transglycosylase D
MFGVAVPSRFILLAAGLFLAGCATTSLDTGDDAVTEPVDLTEVPAPAGTAETVDEHLFEPEPEALPPADHIEHIHPNVWERLVHSFDLPECSDHQSAVDWAVWYAQRPDYMERVVKRSQPWIWMIAEELEFRGMPGELALLPIVESAYDPFAYSSGRALGTWQFVSATGRQYGLQQNWWYDGRRDVWASTHAALDYLMDLHAMFDGDWLLALASYNSGQGRVGRSVARNERAGLPADFWNIKLPRETRGYVPKLMGLTCLFRDPEKYGYTLPDTPNQQVVAAVDPGAQTDLVLVSQVTGVDIDILFTLNPGYNRWATSPEGPHQVVLPTQAATRFETYLQDANPMGMMKWDQVTVQPGDSLSKLASVHHVPVSVIKTVNDLDSDMIRAGQKLRLPRDDAMLVDPLYAAAATELQQLQAGLIATNRVTHNVRSGESLSVIARRYKVSQRDLMQWNKLSDPNKLRVGQTLVVFHSPAQQAPKPASQNYTVRSGDSLWSIARKHKVKLQDLMQWNDLDTASVLQPGQSLKILF